MDTTMPSCAYSVTFEALESGFDLFSSPPFPTAEGWLALDEGDVEGMRNQALRLLAERYPTEPREIRIVIWASPLHAQPLP